MIFSSVPHPDHSGVVWGKSSHSSDPDLGVCVEAAALPGGRHGLRDSKLPTGPVIQLGPGGMRDLLRQVKARA